MKSTLIRVIAVPSINIYALFYAVILLYESLLNCDLHFDSIYCNYSSLNSTILTPLLFIVRWYN